MERFWMVVAALTMMALGAKGQSGAKAPGTGAQAPAGSEQVSGARRLRVGRRPGAGLPASPSRCPALGLLVLAARRRLKGRHRRRSQGDARRRHRGRLPDAHRGHYGGRALSPGRATAQPRLLGPGPVLPWKKRTGKASSWPSMTVTAFAVAGGPWISPAMSMQKVTWSETNVKGGRLFSDTLARPAANEGLLPGYTRVCLSLPAGRRHIQPGCAYGRHDR
jgi:hypothetical protein